MEKAYNFSQVKNCEIRVHYIRLGLAAKWEAAIPWAVAMVSEQGRMKYLRPLYRYVIFFHLASKFQCFDVLIILCLQGFV